MQFFRRNGKIIPIRAKAAGMTAGAVATGAVAIAASKSQAKPTEHKKAFLAAGYGLQVLSGIVSGLPVKGAKGLGANFLASAGIDLASTSAFAKGTLGGSGSRKAKIKDYAKHQATGTALGYATFGATLLAQKSVRKAIFNWGMKAVKWAK